MEATRRVNAATAIRLRFYGDFIKQKYKQ
jgi:hypothetical protein